jgi:hypothetical protein
MATFRGSHYTTDPHGKRFADQLSNGRVTLTVVRYQDNPHPRAGELWTSAVYDVTDNSTGESWPGSLWWYDKRYHDGDAAFPEMFEAIEHIMARQ